MVTSCCEYEFKYDYVLTEKQFQLNINEFTHHPIYPDCSKNKSNNKDYDFGGLIK